MLGVELTVPWYQHRWQHCGDENSSYEKLMQYFKQPSIKGVIMLCKLNTDNILRVINITQLQLACYL